MKDQELKAPKESEELTKDFVRNKSTSRRSKSFNKKRSQKPRGSARTSNKTLGTMKVESPVGPYRSIVFPTNSAAMQTHGNFITSAGQDNFVEAFNVMKHGYGLTDTPVYIKSSGSANRTASAMCIDVLPWFGALDTNTGSINSPIDMAAVNLKQFVDTSFGTRTDYDPQDLMLYLMAVSAIFPIIAELKRDLRLAHTVQLNQYPQFVPRGLYALLGISNASHDFSNGEGAYYVAEHLRSYVDQLNQLILMFNRLPMPPEIAMFGYNDFLFDCIYTDTPDLQTAQLYVFRNSSIWEYMEDLAEGQPPALWYIDIAKGMTIDYRLQLLQHALNKLTALRTSSTAMLQNLFNAYGSRDTVQVPTLDINTLEPLEFAYDEHVCMMIENATILPSSAVTASYVSTVPEKAAISGHIFINEVNGLNYAVNLPLQFHKPSAEITQEDIGWALRMHPAFLNQHAFHAYTPLAPHGSDYSHITADGYTGFLIARNWTIASISDTGEITTQSFVSRNAFIPASNDFQYFPISVATSSRNVDDHIELELAMYYARRDVEVTYRLEDLSMHWTYLTMTLWAGDVNRNVTGSRIR